MNPLPPELKFELHKMNCREKCGACCIALSISSPIPGMPAGKPAGVRCIHLLDDFKCSIYFNDDKPLVCTGFKAEKGFCGSTREDALRILFSLSL
jgi:Fe-S-cluster containining protein